MISIIIEAAENFLHNQIELQTEKTKNIKEIENLRTIIASIDVKMDYGEIKTVYIGYNEELIEAIVSVYLMEDNTDEDTMIDMALESTNMIVGSAKVLAEEAEKEHFMITTPEFKEVAQFKQNKCSEISILNTEKEALIIAIKD